MGSKPKKVTKKLPQKETEITYNPVMSCNGGRHAYVCHGGKSRHFDTSTDEFYDAIFEAGYERFVADLADNSTASEMWQLNVHTMLERAA